MAGFRCRGGLYNGTGVETVNLDDAALDFAIGGLTSGMVKGGTSLGKQVLSKASKVFSFIDDPLVQTRTVPKMIEHQYDLGARQVIPKLVPAYRTLDSISRRGTGGLAAGITNKVKEIAGEYLNQMLSRTIKPALGF